MSKKHKKKKEKKKSKGSKALKAFESFKALSASTIDQEVTGCCMGDNLSDTEVPNYSSSPCGCECSGDEPEHYKESNYTPLGEHPEDRIFKDKEFINRLSEVQNSYFEKLSNDLKLSEEGSNLLFDYVYNEEHDLCFDEWLAKLGINYQSLVNQSLVKENPNDIK